VTFADLFSGIGGFRIALERVGMQCVKSCEIDRFCRSIYKKNFGAEPEVGDIREWQSTSSRRDFPVKTSASLANAPDSPEIKAGYSGSLCEFWNANAPAGFSLRTCPDFCLPIEAEISPSFSMHWADSGMAWRGEYLTLNTSDSPNDAVACGLSDVLEDRVHPRFFLSPKAARGILRRAKKRGRTLPHALEVALIALTEKTPNNSSSNKRSLQNGQKDRAAQRGMNITISSSLELSAEPRPTTGTQILLLRTMSSTKTSADTQLPPITQEQYGADPVTATNSSHPPSGVGAIRTATPPDAVEKTTSTLSVRRLTPLECERLQGFPDNWTRLTDRATRHSETQSRSRSSNGSGGE